MLSEYFRTLGLNEKEELVYLAIAKPGKITASLISKRTEIPRATVYLIVNELAEKGLIATQRTQGTTWFVINEPTAFERLVEEEKSQLKAKEDAAKELVTRLAPFINNAQYTIPKLQIFEGQKGVETMLYDYLPEWRESMQRTGDMTLWGYQDNTFIEHYLRWHNHLWKTMEQDEQIKLFTNSSDIEKQLDHKIVHREVRKLPEGVEFSSSIWLYGEFIVMGMTREKPHYAFLLKDSVLSANLRTIFKLLWQTTAPSMQLAVKQMVNH